MTRTQVYLSADELELLDRVARTTGASRSELIRRAVRATFSRSREDARLADLQRGAGLWRDRGFSGADYVDAARGDLEERLARLGLA